MIRKILHLDLDAFFCAVEELHQPALTGKPFAVGGRPEGRGVVASCSYPARRFGVRSAMPMAQAIRLCPGLLVVPTNHQLYRSISRQVMARLTALTPWVEQISIDEAFLDVSELSEAGLEIARRLQNQIRDELSLPCSLGIAANKLVAKIANNVGKAAGKGNGPPNALTEVVAGTEAVFLAPLDCTELWGVGPKTALQLQARGIRTIGELAQRSPVELGNWLGESGRQLALRARGIDERPVVTEHEPKSVSQETTFAQDVAGRTMLIQTLRRLAEGVARDLRRKQLAGTTVKLKLRRPDFSTPTRQMTLAQPTDDGERIFIAAEQLFDRLWQEGQAIRLLGVGVSGLGAPMIQMELWQQPDERVERISDAVARLRAKYGDGVVMRGTDLDDAPDDPQPPRFAATNL